MRIPLAFELQSRVDDGGGEAKAVAVFAPPPEYPIQARRARLTGRGLYEFIIDRASGRVTDVKVVYSTGHRILDNSVVKAFRQWRFKPGTVKSVKSPVSFTIAPFR